MQHIKEQVKLNDDVIFQVKVYGDSDFELCDGTVTNIHDKGVTIHYLYGYKSLSDLIPWEDLFLIGDAEGESFRVIGYSGRGRILNRDILKSYEVKN